MAIFQVRTNWLSFSTSQPGQKTGSVFPIKYKVEIHQPQWALNCPMLINQYLPIQNLFVYHHKDQINHEFGPQQSNCNLKPSEKRFRLTRANH